MTMGRVRPGIAVRSDPTQDDALSALERDRIAILVRNFSNQARQLGEMKPRRLYSLFQSGVQLKPIELDSVRKHLVEVNICDKRIFKTLAEFEEFGRQIQADKSA